MQQGPIRKYREFLKNSDYVEIDFSVTGQAKGIMPPPMQKPHSDDQQVISLSAKGEWPSVSEIDLVTAIENRRSHRKFKNLAIKPDELAFLLWATQGVKTVLDQSHAFRVIPSAGCRHPFETYLAVLDVQSLEAGIYRYLPLEHGLVFEYHPENLSKELISAVLGQRFVGTAPVTFIWTSIPYRMEWRYGTAASRVTTIEAGHVCQNL